MVVGSEGAQGPRESGLWDVSPCAQVSFGACSISREDVLFPEASLFGTGWRGRRLSGSGALGASHGLVSRHCSASRPSQPADGRKGTLRSTGPQTAEHLQLSSTPVRGPRLSLVTKALFCLVSFPLSEIQRSWGRPGTDIFKGSDSWAVAIAVLPIPSAFI